MLLESTKGRISAWHRIGVGGITPNTLPSQLPGMLNITSPVEKYPAGYLKDGQFYPVTTQQALVRVGEQRTDWYSWVGNNYSYIPVGELMDVLDPLAVHWPVETAGTTHDGRTMWVLFRVSDNETFGDPHTSYFAVVENLDGQHGLQTFYTRVRLMCKNALAAAIAASELFGTIRHDRNVNKAYIDTVELMASFGSQEEKLLETYKRMALTKLVGRQLQELLDATLPLPEKPSIVVKAEALNISSHVVAVKSLEGWEKEVSRRQKARDSISLEYSLLNEELPRMANSVYLFPQAVAAWADHGFAREHSGSASSVLGVRADVKARALRASLELI